MPNSKSQAETKADSEQMPIAPTSSQNVTKPNVGCCLSRAGRSNRIYEDLCIKNKGGMMDLLDDAIKQSLRITDHEYDFIAENISDEEMEMVFKTTLSFAEKRKCLSIVEKYLANYSMSKGSSF